MRPAPELLEAAAHWYVALRDADADDPARTAWRRWLEADARHRQAWERMTRGPQPAGFGFRGRGSLGFSLGPQ